jgi:hypothetical protein
MKARIRAASTLLVGSLAALFNPAEAWAQQGPTAPSNFGVSKETVFWATFVIMTAILAVLFLFIAVGLLRSRDWYLGDAVSEEVGNQPDPLPAGIKPIMVASSSRLIALLGLLNILGVFLGFGYYFLYSAFAGTVSVTDMRSVIYYIFSGAVMFAPYLANQLRDAFSSFGAVRAAPQTIVQTAQPAASPVPMLTRGTGVG